MLRCGSKDAKVMDEVSCPVRPEIITRDNGRMSLLEKVEIR